MGTSPICRWAHLNWFRHFPLKPLRTWDTKEDACCHKNPVRVTQRNLYSTEYLKLDFMVSLLRLQVRGEERTVINAAIESLETYLTHCVETMQEVLRNQPVSVEETFYLLGRDSGNEVTSGGNRLWNDGWVMCLPKSSLYTQASAAGSSHFPTPYKLSSWRLWPQKWEFPRQFCWILSSISQFYGSPSVTHMEPDIQ